LNYKRGYRTKTKPIEQNPSDFVQIEDFPLVIYRVDYNGRYLMRVGWVITITHE